MHTAQRLAGAAIAGSLTLAASPAVAQIVNVQPIIASKEKENGMAAALEGAADMRSGNTRLVALSGSGIVEARSGPHLGFALVRGDFAEKDGEAFLNKDLEHLRYRLDLVGPLSIEAFVQHDRDDFRRLSLRALAGAGPRLRIAPFAGFVAAVGAALLVEYERLDEGPEGDAGDRVVDGRLSTYLFLASTVSPTLTLGNTIYVQPRVDDPGDVRVLHESTLMATATEHVSVKLSMTSAFDAEPPEGVLSLDTTVKGSLQVSF